MEAADRLDYGAERSAKLCLPSGLPDLETVARYLRRTARIPGALTLEGADLAYPSRRGGHLVETAKQDESGVLSRHVANSRGRKRAGAVSLREPGRRQACVPRNQASEPASRY